MCMVAWGMVEGTFVCLLFSYWLCVSCLIAINYFSDFVLNATGLLGKQRRWSWVDSLYSVSIKLSLFDGLSGKCPVIFFVKEIVDKN